jgi:hypothetical protein
VPRPSACGGLDWRRRSHDQVKSVVVVVVVVLIGVASLSDLLVA